MKRRLFSLVVMGAFSSLLLFAGLKDGSKTVTAAGEAEALVASSAQCAWVVIQAMVDNTNNVFIGASTVADGRGMELEPGQSMYFPVIPQDRWHWYDLAAIYVDVETSGEGVTFFYFTR